MRQFSFPIVFLAIFVLVACGGSPSSIAQTLTPYPTYTPYSTYTPFPTYTLYPTYTPFPTATVIVPTDTPTPLSVTSAKVVIEAFIAAGIPISNEITYTAETDPNELLGRPHQYIGKVSWVDTRISTANDASVDNGGTIETFENEEDLLARYNYVDAITKSSLFAEYHYSKGLLFLRISKSFTPDQAKEYENVFMSTP